MDTLQQIKETQTPKRVFKGSRFSFAIQKLRSEPGPEVSLGSWTWYVFPIVRGSTFNSVSQALALKDLSEAQRYLADPILSYRLGYATQVVLDSEESCVRELTGGILYAHRLRASMTLFDHVINSTGLEKNARAKAACRVVLDKYFSGEPDPDTAKYIKEQEALEVARDGDGDNPEKRKLLRTAFNMFLLGLDGAKERCLESGEDEDEGSESLSSTSNY
ncbi:hypothetical protein B0T25DRAFT_567291 [Lasiosphaeria hispida]|uniref:Uncharacterized protein n=1 Tax=Lasiosphaeria hispida TaxID=260671 RepID=A0AAJ0HNC8_9PEZI|nr:hypothetical protein B0T25DRAFT_567291 [Lasiosphaeria hispida]